MNNFDNRVRVRTLHPHPHGARQPRRRHSISEADSLPRLPAHQHGRHRDSNVPPRKGRNGRRLRDADVGFGRVGRGTRRRDVHAQRCQNVQVVAVQVGFVLGVAGTQRGGDGPGGDRPRCWQPLVVAGALRNDVELQRVEVHARHRRRRCDEVPASGGKGKEKGKGEEG